MLTRAWEPYSRLFMLSDTAGWSIAEDMRELSVIARSLGIRVANSRLVNCTSRQAAFHGSQFTLLRIWSPQRHRVAVAYFHGYPGTGPSEFDECYRCLCRHHDQVSRVQVTHTRMQHIILESGIDPGKVFMIRIGVDPQLFPLQTRESRAEARNKYGIPDAASVVGSFQKDGVGWSDGLEPKLIKGPDVFLEAARILRDRIPDLFVLLSGPARGYVMSGLEALDIPYRRVYAKSIGGVAELLQACDVSIIPSRQEGGPKAVLEGMASGVPVVSTRVGQAPDLIDHGRNGWLADVEDAEALAHWTQHVLADAGARSATVERARLTAEANSYQSQIPQWLRFFSDFVQVQGDGE